LPQRFLRAVSAHDYAEWGHAPGLAKLLVYCVPGGYGIGAQRCFFRALDLLYWKEILPMDAAGLRKEVFKMIFNLTSGEVIHIGATVTLTVLTVEGDLVHFGLKTLEGESPGAEDIDKGYAEANLKQRRNRWELS
jgi:hypothetical protein